jgi:hypothetical protein
VAVVALGLATALGGVIGFAWDWLEVELPFALAELLLGAICATGCALAIGLFQGMPSWKLTPRLLPAALFGSLAGLCLSCIWWSWDLPGGGLAVGLVAGFFSAPPVIVSFGLLGGESRPIGALELSNTVINIAAGTFVAFFVVLGDVENLSSLSDLSDLAGAAGLIGLVSAFGGGRANIWQVMQQARSGDDWFGD